MQYQLEKESKIFVYCPSGAVTGGAELLHQLVDILNNNGREAYIVYFGRQVDSVIPDDYIKYNIRIANDIEDDSKNVVVLYEGYFKKLFEIKKAQVFLWWLSVDNYFTSQQYEITIADCWNFNKKLVPGVLLRQLLRLKMYKKNHFSLKQLSQNPQVVLNGYQSEYAHLFLRDHKFTNLVRLKDYVNTDNFRDINYSLKEDIVVYNPKKGMNFTKKLIENAPDIKWIPIINMNRNKVIETLSRAKVYIDFGHHPGKDRLPREAAMNGCCIITGKRGSAGIYEDIPIPSQYKFNQKSQDIDIILYTIRNCITDYDSCIGDFISYRDHIFNEKSEFENDVIKIFVNENC